MRTLLSIILSLLALKAIPQTLIPNPSFEDLTRCPSDLGQLSKASPWSSPTTATPDLFNACYFKPTRTLVSVPNNIMDFRAALDGKGYAGIRYSLEETEYIQVKLDAPLIQGHRYVIRFRTTHPHNLSKQFDTLQITLRQGPIQIETPHPLPDTGQVLQPAFNPNPQKEDWRLSAATFVAQGGEDHIIIGYFRRPHYHTYTFIDLLELYECPVGTDCLSEYYDGYVDGDSINLVPNGSFEAHYECPQDRAQLKQARGWRVAANSPDFFHRCGTGNAAIPINELGDQWPHTGDAYGGFWAYIPQNGDYREFLSIKLKEPLLPLQRYQISLWLSLAEVSNFALCGLTVRADTCLPKNLLLPPPDHVLTVQMQSELPLTDRLGWTHLKATFTAEGDERYLTIGNYRTALDDCLIPLEGRSVTYKAYDKSAYYYVDDLRLIPLHDLPPPAHLQPDNPQDPPTWAEGDTLTLGNLLFGFDQADLHPHAYPLLDSLATFLHQHPHIRIDITGHTDSEGPEDYNWRLSQRRALSIRTYLITQAIPPDRISAGGLGEARPRFPNDTPRHREANRRVEIIFFQD